MFAYLAGFMGTQGATAFICCFLTSAVQLLILVLSYRKFKHEIRFSSFHQKQLEVLGELYKHLVLTRGYAHNLTLVKPTENRYLTIGDQTVTQAIEYSTYFESNLIYIPKDIRRFLMPFKDIIVEGLMEHNNTLSSGLQTNYSRDNLAEFIVNADKILETLDKKIRHIIGA